MKRLHRIYPVFVLLAALTLPAMETDQDVLYLTNLSEKPLRVRVLRHTRLNITRASNTYLTTLAKGQYVSVLAIAPHQLQVRGRMSTGSVQGWVNRDDLSPISDDVVASLSKKKAKQEEIEEAIKRKEVLFGMTREQVQQMLGKPEDKSSVQDEAGVTEVWTYYTYRSMPIIETYGAGTNVVSQVYSGKVRVGSKSISFKNGQVVRIEQKSENTGTSGISIPPAPYPPVWRIPKSKVVTPYPAGETVP
jgi:outer membrane protein assembly factor BamE (lipoprotein component of BamABCDE complex)